MCDGQSETVCSGVFTNGGNTGRLGAWGEARWCVWDCVVQHVREGVREKRGEPVQWSNYLWPPVGEGERAGRGEVVCSGLLGVSGRRGCARWTRLVVCSGLLEAAVRSGCV